MEVCDCQPYAQVKHMSHARTRAARLALGDATPSCWWLYTLLCTAATVLQRPAEEVLQSWRRWAQSTALHHPPTPTGRSSEVASNLGTTQARLSHSHIFVLGPPHAHHIYPCAGNRTLPPLQAFSRPSGPDLSRRPWLYSRLLHSRARQTWPSHSSSITPSPDHIWKCPTADRTAARALS